MNLLLIFFLFDFLFCPCLSLLSLCVQREHGVPCLIVRDYYMRPLMEGKRSCFPHYPVEFSIAPLTKANVDCRRENWAQRTVTQRCISHAIPSNKEKCKCNGEHTHPITLLKHQPKLVCTFTFSPAEIVVLINTFILCVRCIFLYL